MDWTEKETRVGTSLRAESVPAFRMAQLLLVLTAAAEQAHKLDIERLSVIEFLAANPFLVLPEGSKTSNELRIRGFGKASISYASPGQRFVSRRARIASDTAQLVAFGLASVSAHEGRRVLCATPAGVKAAVKLCSVYADAYRFSTSAVLPIVMKLSPKQMRERLKGWLRADPIFFDLFDSPTVDELDDELSSLNATSSLF